MAPNVRRSLAAVLLAATLIIVLAARPTMAEPAIESVERYTTAEMIERTIRALPACLGYCLVGVEIRLRVTPWSIEVYFVPRVEHHLASLHVVASDEFTREPYIEWAAIFGTVQKAMLDALARVIAIEESGGRQTRYERYGDHQATHFKELEILGHPVAILPRLVDSTGSFDAEELLEHYRELEETPASGFDIAGFITRWSRWAGSCFADPLGCALRQPAFPGAYLAGLLGIAEAMEKTIEALEAIEGVLAFAEMAETLQDIARSVGSEGFGVGGGVRIDRLLTIHYFMPYYLSGPDALFWRSGFPITDAHHAVTLLNPFSSDRVASTDRAWLEARGHIYPRAGFVNNDHPGRAAAVIASRGQSLLADRQVTLRPKITFANAHGSWQNLSPEPTRYCESNIADLPTPIDEAGGYGYNLWAKYTCPLSEVGFMVAFIPYRYCF